MLEELLAHLTPFSAACARDSHQLLLACSNQLIPITKDYRLQLDLENNWGEIQEWRELNCRNVPAKILLVIQAFRDGFSSIILFQFK